MDVEIKNKIIDLINQKFTHREIATALKVSVGTVSKVRNEMLEQIQATDSREVKILANRLRKITIQIDQLKNEVDQLDKELKLNDSFNAVAISLCVNF
jgi:orotate phosphoribosyltransferase-like protein